MEKIKQSLYDELSGCCKGMQLSEQNDRQLKASADFEFPPSYVGFNGHFPGRPVLPAIVQLAAVRYLSERALGTQLSPLLYSRTKFKGMVLPGMKVVVSVRLELQKEGWSGMFTLKRDSELVATGNVVFAAHQKII